MRPPRSPTQYRDAVLPDGAAAVIGVLLFLAPGFVYLVLRGPRRERGVADDLAVIAAVAILCTAASLLVLALVRAVHGAWILDLGAWIRTGDFYWHRSYDVVVRTVALEVVLAIGIAWIAHLVVASRARTTRAAGNPDDTLWPLDGSDPEATRPQPEAGALVMARTSDGTLYRGHFEGIHDSGVLPPVLGLRGPISYRRAGDAPESPSPSWDRLALALAGITELWVESRPPETPAPGSPAAPTTPRGH
jgi:hypothetical protein